MRTFTLRVGRVGSVALFAALAAAIAPVHAAPNSYQSHTLVSDVAAIPADHHDANLKNAWGVAFNPTGFVWVADNHSGKSTLYDGKGNVQSLVVTIPAASGPTGTGSPTGIVFSGSPTDFVVTGPAGSGPARFIFASEDGVISAWAPQADPTHAIVGWTNPNAVYKGIALTGDGGAHFFLYAADFRNRRIDVYDSTFHPVTLAPGAFQDPRIPSDYGPFNVTAIQGNLYVAYAKRDPNSDDEVAGAGFGFVDVYDADGNLLQRLASRGTLNAPWGMALAPTGFGRFSNQLLVGNFGDGMISAFEPHTGKFLGRLRTPQGKLLQIGGLWGIAFGNGILDQQTDTLFFAAGPNDENDGIYGRIDAVLPMPGHGNDDDD